MAGDWIKMDIELHEKGAVIAMAETLKMGDFAPDKIMEDLIVGKLKKFWSWADRQASIEGEDGIVRGATFNWIDTKLLGVNGFCKAMQSAGWLDYQDGRLIIPGFARNNGKSAKARVMHAKRAADSKRQPSSPSTPRTDPEEKKPRDPPEFDPAIELAWKELATVYAKTSGGKEMKIDQSRRYLLAEALDNCTLEELLKGWRWYLTATSERAQMIRAGGKGITTFLRADKTRSYIEMAEEEEQTQAPADRPVKAKTDAYLEEARKKMAAANAKEKNSA